MGREIKVFCSEHQTAFDVELKAQLVCEIREHSLSVGFPLTEFWQYCCNCQTFSLNDFETGGKAPANCFHCEREIKKLFVCAHCKTVCYDSSEETRGQKFKLSFSNGISPHCPACEKAPTLPVHEHQCDQIQTVIATSRPLCPFCQKQTEVIKSPPVVIEDPVEKFVERCPQCQTQREPDANICIECGYDFRSASKADLPAEVIPQASSLETVAVRKVYCPKCGSENLEGSEFCGDCGASLVLKNSEAAPIDHSFNQQIIKYSVGGISLFILFIVFVAVIISARNNKAPATNSNTFVNAVASKTPTLSATPNKSNGDFRIGKQGRLNIDTNLRKYASKDSQWLGTHYAGALLEVLDVDTSGPQTWFKIKITTYGTSLESGRTGKDAGSEDVGWVNSFPMSRDGKTRTTLVDFIN